MMAQWLEDPAQSSAAGNLVSMSSSPVAPIPFSAVATVSRLGYV